MNARIVNLRQARKQAEKARKRADADANAVKHGRTRAEREGQDLEQARATRHVDGHRLDDSGDDG